MIRHALLLTGTWKFASGKAFRPISCPKILAGLESDRLILLRAYAQRLEEAMRYNGNLRSLICGYFVGALSAVGGTAVVLGELGGYALAILPGLILGSVVAAYTRRWYWILSLLTFTGLLPASFQTCICLLLVVNSPQLALVLTAIFSCMVALVFCRFFVANFAWKPATFAIVMAGLSGWVLADFFSRGGPDPLAVLTGAVLWQAPYVGVVSSARSASDKALSELSAPKD